MAITNSTNFDVVQLYSRGVGIVGISVYNEGTYVESLSIDYATRSYNTSTDEFQIILAAIQEGTAYERYRFLDGSTYTDDDLPSWLIWAKDQNPFHIAQQLQVSADPKPLPQIYFKEVPLPTADNPVDTTPPSLEYDSPVALRAGLRLVGFYQQKALVQVDQDNSVLLVLRTLETETPIVTNGQITGYNFTAISNGVTAGSAQYSVNGSTGWHGTLQTGDKFISTLLTDGTWHIQELTPTIVIIPSGTTKKVERGSSYGAYSQSVVKNIDVSGTSLSDISNIIIRAEFYDSWGNVNELKLGNIIEFLPDSVELITPATQQAKRVFGYDTIDHKMAWQYSIDGTTGQIDQGLLTGETLDRTGKNVGWVSLVEYPHLIVYETFNNGAQLSVNSAAGLEAGDTIFLDHEQMRFNSVEGGADVFTQDGGEHVPPRQTINVTRAINGTERRTAEHSYYGTGLVDARNVLRYVSFWNMFSPTEWPFRFFLTLEQTG